MIIHIFFLPHFNPNIFLRFYPGEITARNEFSFFLGYAVALATSYPCANWFPLSLGNRQNERIQNSGGYFRAVGLVILGGYGRPDSVAFFFFRAFTFFAPCTCTFLEICENFVRKRVRENVCVCVCVCVCMSFFSIRSLCILQAFVCLSSKAIRYF